MANAPIPPLFCSTPPPIDENEDFGAYQENISDDEFDDFHSGAPQIYDDITSNANNETIAKNLFPTPNIPLEDLNCDFKNNITNTNEIGFSKHSKDLEKDLNKISCENDLKHHNNRTSLSSLSEQTSSISTQSESPPPNTESCINDDDGEEENDNDKEFGEFQYDVSSNELAKSDSGRSTENDEILEVQEVEKNKNKKSVALSNIVVLEDIIDDSSDDERHSPKNRNNFVHCDENSNDYFSIQPVERLEDNEKEIQESTPENKVCIEEQISTQHIPQLNTVEPSAQTQQENSIECATSNAADTEIGEVSDAVASSSIPCNDDKEDFDDDFATFQDFTTTTTDIQDEWTTKCENIIENISVEHSSTKVELCVTQNDQKEETNSKEDSTKEDAADDNDDFDDDDFGDFSEAPISVPIEAPSIHQQATPVLKQNLATQLKPVLEIMFPSNAISNASAVTVESMNNGLQSTPMELAYVESAKALDYQWVGSNVRHALIRSLGIDSRNIFLTEKWNPSMPRFAANLSFDPLQPLKPTTTPLQPEIVSNSANTTKTDVPVAEFDWKSSGLVNPLDASHVHTLLLDVDQLVVVANLDNINLDSSSSCSQSSPTRASTAKFSSSMQINENVKTGLTMASINKTSIGKTNMDRKSNGTILNAFHGDNLQIFSTTTTTNADYYASTLCTDTLNSCNITAANRIIDLHDTNGCIALLSTTTGVDVDALPSNNCNISLHHMHNHNYYNKNIINNNNNANTSHDAFNAIDTLCFDASTITTSSASNVMLPTTSVAFTNHLQFNNNNLHHSMAAPTSTSTSTSSTPISTFNLTPITTTTTTTTTITEITNIAHHFEQNQNQMPMMSSSECIKMNLYREFRPQEEMAARSIDAVNAESGASNSHNENDGDTSSSSSHTSTETPAAVASATGATLSSTIAGSSDVDSADNDFGKNIDIGLYDMLKMKSNTPVPTEVICSEINELEELEENTVTTNHNSDNLDTLGFNTTETTISLDENVEVHIDNGVISRSTYAGPLKETHIFTPPKIGPDSNDKTVSLTRSIAPSTIVGISKTFPIDFDYEKAAAGIIIDETVVRKEYRDIEYNPGFSLEAIQVQSTELTVPQSVSTLSQQTLKAEPLKVDEVDDEFSDFQSVSLPVSTTARIATPKIDKLQTPVDGMILSPAILLPQAISIASKQPKIEWGDSVTSINPEELARIEELFPQDSSARSDSRKSTPTHGIAMQQNSLSISASIGGGQAKQQQHDDDDWSDFVSVPVPVSVSTSNKNLPAPQKRSPQKLSSNTNDDEWSDFVSSTPNAHVASSSFRASPVPNSYGLPQFNSASWQNVNFYNNPLSVYHRNHQTNAVPNATPTKLQNNNYSSHNNINNHNNNNNSNSNSNNNNNNYTQYLSNYQQPTTQQLHLQQQIQIMQDFSTAASVPTYRPNIPPSHQAYMQSNYPGSTTGSSHFQVGSAKVAPTVSLIPDLGFVAPAMPMHTAIINALPKPGAGVKK